MSPDVKSVSAEIAGKAAVQTTHLNHQHGEWFVHDHCLAMLAHFRSSISLMHA